MRRIFVTDCEGPVSKNDNAYEITSRYVPNGDRLYTVISRYDDVLADIVKKPGYRAGTTLKLVLPFLKAHGLTNKGMQRFSAKNLILIQHAKEMLDHARSIMHVFIVSTSYEHYMRALCRSVGFPYENTYCTKVNIDRHTIPEKEKTELKRIAQEIAQMPIFDVPADAETLKDLDQTARAAVKRLDQIFWKEMTETESYKLLKETDIIGGSEKAAAVEEIAKKLHADLADVMYVGDSITDEQAFKLVRENSGLAVSFNGNQYAVKQAEVAVMSQGSIATATIADAFAKGGKQEALGLAENWSALALRKSRINRDLLSIYSGLQPHELPKVKIITTQNMEALAKESSQFRKRVRGEAVGGLG